MKKINLIFFFFFVLFVCFGEVNASKTTYDKEITNKDELAAKCVYTGYNTWYIYIDKKYKISAFSPDVTYGQPTGAYFTTIHSSFDFNQELFVGDDGNIKCENVSTLYAYFGADSDAYTGCDDEYSTCYRYKFSSKEQKHYKKLTLDSSKSEVYVENVAKDEIESGNWKLVCNYGPYYLFYSDTTFETNAAYKDLYTHEGISTIINENYGACPTTYCEYTIHVGFDYPVQYSYFTNEYESRDGCYVSQQYAGGYKCGMLENRMKLYHKAYEDSDKKLIVKIREDIKVFCSGVLSHLNYTDPNNCVKECMEVIGILQKDENLTSGQCGLSGKLILWIANIVKWIKYIVPVIAIVMGILDFIKAIANGKDDEIKKAQGHFIKRLIAAALIFITPFIIEFILDKMGFDANGCGIIDL